MLTECRVIYPNYSNEPGHLILKWFDLIEQAFLEGQIDGLRADLAYLWLRNQAEFLTLE